MTEGFFASASLRKFVAKECRREPFDLVMGYSSSTLPYVLAAPTGARIDMDPVNVDTAKWAAYAQNAHWPASWLYRKESRTVNNLKVKALAQCDAVLLVSEVEARLLSGQSRGAVAIGNGVDTEYFTPRKPEGKHPRLVFTGTMDYRPNIEGVCWFAREVWPELRRRQPNLSFDIVGRNPAPLVSRLAQVPGIRVTGSVPECPALSGGCGRGGLPAAGGPSIQNKILEAMAMARAVVASPGGIEGLDVQVGQEILRAKSPEQWVDAIEGLLSDQARATRSAGRHAAASKPIIPGRPNWRRWFHCATSWRACRRNSLPSGPAFRVCTQNPQKVAAI